MHKVFWAVALLFLAACSLPSVNEPPTEPETAPVATLPGPDVTLSASRTSGEDTFSATFSAKGASIGSFTYQWSIDGSPVAGSSSQETFTFRGEGVYVVEVKVSNGSVSSQARSVVEVTDYLRPSNAPDVVILGFAGRCGFGIGCTAPVENKAYLEQAGTLQEVEQAFRSQGYTTQSQGFRAHLWDDSLLGLGFESAEEILEAVRDQWIKDYADPTRVVLVSHSHGAQFMSLLALDHPEITFDYAIYLDAVCLGWMDDHSYYFASSYGARANYPFPLDQVDACDQIYIPGVGNGGEDISDIVPENVRYGIEVSSVGLRTPVAGVNTGAVRDDDPNHRFDGSTRDLSRLDLSEFAGIPEGHNEVHLPGSFALNWATAQLYVRGLP